MQAQGRARRGREALAATVVAALLALLAVGLAAPWTDAAAGTPALRRYLPLADGSAALVRSERPDGVVWESQSVLHRPVLQALGEWVPELRAGLEDVLGGSDDAALRRYRDAVAVEVRSRELDESGEITEATTYLLRSADGDALLGFVGPDGTTAFDPPLRTLPGGDLEPGRRWESEGAFGAASYRATGEVVGQEPWSGPAGSYDDCLRVAATLEIRAPDGGVVADSEGEDVYCAGTGAAVESVSTDLAGGTTRTTLVAGTGVDQPADDAPRPEPRPLEEAQPPRGDPAEWEAGVWGRASRTTASGEATTPPVVVPGEQPLVLLASHGGDLVAFDATRPGEVAWRYRTGGTVYGAPTVDAAHGRIYLGATDKRVHAVDARGLFLWSSATSDNVATAPLVVDDVVVVGSEDRQLHAFDAATGAPRWDAPAGGPVVADPASVAGLVVAGSDAGDLRGLEPADGDERWTVEVGAPVVAGVAVAGDGAVAVAASTDGEVVAVRADDGEQLWRATTEQTVRTTPLVLDGGRLVVVVGEDGAVVALDGEDGSERWRTDGSGRLGPAVAVGGELLVARYGGEVDRIDPADGRVLGTLPGASEGTLEVGLGTGAGAAWLADDTSTLVRLGPPSGAGDVRSLSPSWLVSAADGQGVEGFLDTPPVPWGDEVLHVDSSGYAALLDPATGALDPLGETVGSAQAPVVAGDTAVLVDSDGAVHAVGLPDLDERWSTESLGRVYREPVVADGTVLVAALPEGADTPVVSALDAGDGEERWSTRLDAAPFPPGLAVAGDRVQAGAHALDLATGRVRWTADLEGHAVAGAPAVAPDGAAYLTTVGEDDSTRLVAVEPDGAVRWTVDAPVVGPRESVVLVPGADGGDDLLVLPVFAGGVAAHSVADGAPVWEHEVSGGGRFGGLLVDTGPGTGSGLVWVPTAGAQVDVLDVRTGDVAARFAALDLDLAALSDAERPVRLGDTVVVPFSILQLGFPADAS